MEIVERMSRERFGINVDEFARRWHAGELQADRDPGAVEIALLLPLVET